MLTRATAATVVVVDVARREDALLDEISRLVALNKSLRLELDQTNADLRWATEMLLDKEK